MQLEATMRTPPCSHLLQCERATTLKLDPSNISDSEMLSESQVSVKNIKEIDAVFIILSNSWRLDKLQIDWHLRSMLALVNYCSFRLHALDKKKFQFLYPKVFFIFSFLMNHMEAFPEEIFLLLSFNGSQKLLNVYRFYKILQVVTSSKAILKEKGIASCDKYRTAVSLLFVQRIDSFAKASNTCYIAVAS